MEAHPLVGRDAALEAARQAIRADHPLAVVGEAGIGKTALVRAAAEAEGRNVREGGGFGTLSWLPYLALRRAIGRPIVGEAAEIARVVETTVGPDLLFIDDLQWVDDDSRRVLKLLAGHVALALAIRTGDEDALGAAELASDVGASVVQLGGVDGEAAAEIARRARPGIRQADLARVLRDGGGNPLLIEELAIRGAGSSSLARVLARQLTSLRPAERRAVELLAVAERPLPAGSVGGAGSALVELQLATAAAGFVGLRHALIAEAVRASLDPASIRSLHAALGDPELSPDPLERGRHLVAAGSPVGAARIAIDALSTEPLPARRASLLALAAGTDDPAEADRLRVEAGAAARALGDVERAIELLEPALAGPDALHARRAAELAAAYDAVGRAPEAWALVEAARALRVPPGSTEAIALADVESSLIVNGGGSYDDAIALLETARDRGGTAAPYGLRGSLETLRLFSHRTTDTTELDAAWRDALAAGDGGAAANLAIDLHYAVLMNSGGGPALRTILEAAELVAAQGFGARADQLRAEGCQVSIFAGELAGTVILADTALERPMALRPRARGLYMRGMALALMGRFDDAEATLDEVAGFAPDDFDGIGHVLWGQAELAFWTGRPARAIELVEIAVTKDALSPHEYILPGLVRAWSEHDLGRPITPALDVQRSRVLAGAGPEHRGITLLADGNPGAARAAFEEAATTWAGHHVTREPLCWWAAGEAARLDGDAEAATAMLERALGQAEGQSFEPLASRVKRSLRLLGRRIAAPSGPRSGAAMLTLREREILGLAGRGQTNAEIARRMGLGRPTVARMLSNAMAKLGADSRAQAVVLAADAVR